MKIYNLSNQVTLAERVRIADNFLGRLVGLLNKNSMEDTEGLVIRPCKAIHTWFMRFSIDVLFLDKNDQVIQIIKDMSPGKKSPYVKGAGQVIELAAGRIATSGTKIGDVIKIKEEN